MDHPSPAGLHIYALIFQSCNLCYLLDTIHTTSGAVGKVLLRHIIKSKVINGMASSSFYTLLCLQSGLHLPRSPYMSLNDFMIRVSGIRSQHLSRRQHVSPPSFTKRTSTMTSGRTSIQASTVTLTSHNKPEGNFLLACCLPPSLASIDSYIRNLGTGVPKPSKKVRVSDLNK